MINKENKKVETSIQQKKNGVFGIKRLRFVKLNASEIIGAVVRTSEDDTRIELARRNELGFPSEGLYLYSGGIITTAIVANTIFFYDNDGNNVGVIQMPTAGHLGISFESMLLQGGGDAYIEIDASGVLIESDTFSIYLSSAGIQMNGLPTSNPGGTNLLWRDSGTIKIT